MFEKAKPARDAFTFSLGGMTAIASFAAAPVIADDRLRQATDNRPKRPQPGSDRQQRLWTSSYRQAVECCCG